MIHLIDKNEEAIVEVNENEVTQIIPKSNEIIIKLKNNPYNVDYVIIDGEAFSAIQAAITTNHLVNVNGTAR